MKQFCTFFLLTILPSVFLFGQKTSPASSQTDKKHQHRNVPADQRLELFLRYTFSPAISVQRQYPAGGEVDLTGNALTGVEGGLTFVRRLSQNFGFYAGGVIGALPHGYTMNVTPEFGSPFSRMIEVTGSKTYLGTRAGGEFFTNPEKRRFLSIGAGLGAIYFPPSGPSQQGFFVISNTGSTTFIPETEFYVNPEKTLILAPELLLRFHHRLGRRFIAHLGVMGTYTKKRPIIAEKFAFKSDTQTLEGSFSKQFAYPAIELGVSMRLKRPPEPD